MEKDHFVDMAPYYYALAIAVSLRDEKAEYTYRDSIRSDYSGKTSIGRDYNYLGIDALFERGVFILADLSFLSIIPDDFGPSLYKRSQESEGVWEKLILDHKLPFYKYSIAGPTAKTWLLQALNSINSRYSEMKIEPADFEKENVGWEPIPLDRSNEKLHEATAALERTIEAVRVDNGYASTRPEEKAYVMDNLRAAAKKLKEDESVSWMFLKKYTLEPLGILSRRFGQAAIGITALATRTAILDWLKGIGVRVLESFFK